MSDYLLSRIVLLFPLTVLPRGNRDSGTVGILNKLGPMQIKLLDLYTENIHTGNWQTGNTDTVIGIERTGILCIVI